MFRINLQLFGGGGASSGLGGGRGDKDAINSNAKTYRFVFIDQNGKERFMDIRGESKEEAIELFKLKLRLNNMKVRSVKLSEKKEPPKKIARNVTDIVDSIEDRKHGNVIDLSDSNLQFTSDKSGLGKNQMDTIKDIAREIRDKSVEDITAFDSNGKKIYNKEGTATEVSTPHEISIRESYDIHNHTRGEGVLSGTFSVIEKDDVGDMVSFTNYANKTAAFAAAKEGIYYISKTDGFKPSAFFSHMRKFDTAAKERMDTSLKSLEDRYNRTNMTYDSYKKLYNRIKNRYLVEMHNEYLKNQSKYGYHYGLLKWDT